MCNLYRDLFKKLQQQGCVQPTMVLLPLRNRRGVTHMMRWPILAPHEVIAHMFDVGCWRNMLIGDYDLDHFWTELLKEPWFEQLAAIINSRCDALRLPLRLHGDEGRFYNLKSVLILSLGGICHRQDPYTTRALLTVLPSTRYSYGYRLVPVKGNKRRKLKINKTFMAISEFLAWSLEICAKGTWPMEPFA